MTAYNESFSYYILCIFAGLLYHEEMCVQLDEKKPEETKCSKGYLNITNSRLLFDPEKKECFKIYDTTKQRLSSECENRDDSQNCLINLESDKRSHPECFQLYELYIAHTCQGKHK